MSELDRPLAKARDVDERDLRWWIYYPGLLRAINMTVIDGEPSHVVTMGLMGSQ